MTRTTASVTDEDERVERLIHLFNDGLGAEFDTRLVRGDDEPIYLPADDACPHHRIVFAHGFFASALHEIAHWCIAGAHRRRLEDYGYWYAPDGRDARQQRQFETVETRPQALEWAFSLAAGCRFRVSVDNLGGVPVDRDAFRARVHTALLRYAERGFPGRAARFIDDLRHAFGGSLKIPAEPGRD